MMEPETCEYLDGEWTIRGSGPILAIDGPDGDPILTCDTWNAAHFLTPEAVAEYLIEQHGAAKRLAARERDIKRAVEAIGRAASCWTDPDAAACLRAARQALQPLPKPKVPMPETEPQMLVRLKALAADPSLWGEEISPQEKAAIRWAVATIERYRTALEKYANHTTSCLAEPSNPAWTGECNCGVDKLMAELVALAPEPEAPGE
jgi:hypothetical protein